MTGALAACCMLAAASASGAAGSGAARASYVRRQLPGAVAAAAPVVDGRITDPAWTSAAVAEEFVDPLTGSTSVDQTTARVLYDRRFIYVAFHCRDSQPDQIVGRETNRDVLYQTGPQEDCVEVVLDPFLTHRSTDMTRFAVNAIGTRSALMGGGRARKVEWSGDWDGSAQRVPDGWVAEMRIPWGILNYPSARGPATMGINFRRYQYRTKLYSMWSNTGPQQFDDLEGLWTGVQVPAGAFRPQLSVLQYVLPGSGPAGLGASTGFDARYTPTPELTVVGTANPDFSTIEGAVESIQFSRGERFLPETRPFFLEGASYFEIQGAGMIGRYFYSQRIRSFDLGAKVYGKLGRQDSLGFLQAVDLGGRRDTVVRYRHDFSATSTTNVLVSQRSGAGPENSAGLLAQRSRWGKLIMDAQVGATMGRGAGGSSKSFGLTYADKTMSYTLGLVDIGEKVWAADGYIPFTGYRGGLLQVNGGTEWRRGPWRGYNMTILPYYLLHTDGRPLQRGIESSFSFDTRSDWRFALDVIDTKWDDQKDATIGVTIAKDISNRFRSCGLAAQTGVQGGRPSTFIGPVVHARVLRGLDLGYWGAFQNLDGMAQQHIASLRYELSPTQSIGGRLVVQNGVTNWYLSYRSAGARGAETYLILGDPNAPKFRSRLTLKCVFPL